MASKDSKTNALRYLDTHKIPYLTLTYDILDGAIDGLSVCRKLKQDPDLFYKTLVAKDTTNQVYVLLVAVSKSLDLKGAAAALGLKSLELLDLKDLYKTTGYQRGGCSPIGMKKKFTTCVDIGIENIPSLIISAGRPGLAMKLRVQDFLSLTQAKVCTLTVAQ